MKHSHNNYVRLMGYMSGLFLLLSIALPFSAQATPLDLATVPLANSPTITIRANLLFIFDDSGSMADDSMPDVSNSTTPYLFRNASYNTIYYNPAVRYLPPAYFTASGINTTTYPSQTGDATASGASSAAKPNWKVVKKDAYGKVATGTTDLTADAFYFTTIPGEFCKNADLKVCNAQTAANATYPSPPQYGGVLLLAMLLPPSQLLTLARPAILDHLQIYVSQVHVLQRLLLLMVAEQTVKFLVLPSVVHKLCLALLRLIQTVQLPWRKKPSP